MTCKDCIHECVCAPLCSGIDMNLMMQDKNVELLCSNFKDKSRFIELPCKVGDVVFWITTDNKIRWNKVFSIKIESKDDHYTYFVKCGIFNQFSMFYEFVIGRDCFLTKEEAEKALNEREKNG